MAPQAQDAATQQDRLISSLNTRLVTRDEQAALLQDQLRALENALLEATSSGKASEVRTCIIRIVGYLKCRKGFETTTSNQKVSSPI